MEGSQAVRAQITPSATPVGNSREKFVGPTTATSSEKIGIGVKGRLQLAFGAITLFVVIAAGVGLYAFFEVGKSLERITEKALPPALTAGELLTKAEYIVAAGPALLAANTADEINRLSASAVAELANATKLLDQLRRADLDPTVLDGIREDISALNANLALLQKTTSEKVSAETRRGKLIDVTFSAHNEFDRVWEPRFADMRSRILQLQRMLVSPIESQQERRAQVNNLDQAILALLPLEQIRREFSAAFELILRGSTTTNTRELAEFRNQAQRSIRAIDGLVSDIDPDLSTDLFRPIAQLRADVRGETNVFGLRQIEIDAIARSKQLIAENAAFSAHLHNSVEQLVSSSRNDIANARLAAKQAQEFNANVLLSVTVLAVISSFLIVWLYVGRNVVGRISALSKGTLAIAAGRRDVPVAVGGNDEVAAMARAVEVFRGNAIALDQLLVERAQAAERLEKVVEERTAELQRQGDILLVTFNNMADGVVMFDKSMRLAARNPRFDEILELPATFYSSEKRYSDFLRFMAERGEYGQIDVEAQVNRLVADTNKHSTYERTRPDGTVLEIRHNPLPGGGWVSIYSDITDRKHYEEALTAARDHAEAASRTKSSFLANMSHELRTPLNAILGYTELILDNIYGQTPEKMRAVLERLERNGKHLLGLINDVLDFSKIEAGQVTLALEDYSIKDVVHGVYSAVEPLAAEKRLAFKVEVPPDLPRGRGDERRLTQVLLNLVGNAIKFTDAGEVAIKASSANGSFNVSVHDTGPGISAADQMKLFADFQQVDDSTTKKKGGTGLGLAISKRIIELHGGRIWVDSSVGQGSTFSFSLPVTVAQQAMPA